MNAALLGLMVGDDELFRLRNPPDQRLTHILAGLRGGKAEAEKYARDLERDLTRVRADFDSAAGMAAVHGWRGGFGEPVCYRCHGRGKTWAVPWSADPEFRTCGECDGSGKPPSMTKPDGRLDDALRAAFYARVYGEPARAERPAGLEPPAWARWAVWLEGTEGPVLVDVDRDEDTLRKRVRGHPDIRRLKISNYLGPVPAK